jgi:hypothetical protein
MRSLDRLNQIPRLRPTTKVFIPENNYANEGSHMAHMVRNRTDVHVFWEKETKPGIQKVHESAEEYQYLFNVKAQNDCIRFDADCYTTSPGYTVESIKALARRQLEQCHIEFEEPKTLFGKGKQTITGKSGNRDQDDLSIAIQMGVYWGRRAMLDPRRIK